jgi:23S rRNA pseudouridine1911/1915/1917 synthase
LLWYINPGVKSFSTLGPDSYQVTHYVDAGYSGMRLDHFLMERYSRRSRAQIQRAIDAGVITIRRLQGAHLHVGKLKPSSPLVGGDEVLVLSERKPEPAVSFDYRIIHEDESLLVIDKPANLPVHPAGSYFFNTLLVHLRTRGQDSGKPVELKAEREYYLVHRIDKETSGVLVLAKTREVCAGLTAQFAERRTEKTYLAIVKGVPPSDFEVDLAMKRDPDSMIKLKMKPAPVEDGGYTALTRFKRLKQSGGFSLLECHPKTGRQHQIRVHLAARGFPIVGDKLYGLEEREAFRFYERRNLSPEALAQLILPRHALHAHRIAFEHPLTGKRHEYSSPLPHDLATFLATQ